MSKKQACKPRSYASLKLRLTDLLSGAECRATSVAKNYQTIPIRTVLDVYVDKVELKNQKLIRFKIIFKQILNSFFTQVLSLFLGCTFHGIHLVGQIIAMILQAYII